MDAASKSSIVLIHGSTQNAACWDLVRPYLSAGGHQTITVERRMRQVKLESLATQT